jgi:hypothetical protein
MEVQGGGPAHNLSQKGPGTEAKAVEPPFWGPTMYYPWDLDPKAPFWGGERVNDSSHHV